MIRTYNTIKTLRSFYPELIRDDRNPLQLFIGQMRYSAHTLSFFESNKWQKLWALYATGWLGNKIATQIKSRGPLRIDFINEKYTKSGKIGLTILPGRKDNSRVLGADIKSIIDSGITHVITLVTNEELIRYGVEDLVSEFKKAGLVTKRFPINDQGVSTIEETNEVVNWMETNLNNSANIMIHCVGGLGRTGLVSASYLINQGLSAQDAINEIRSIRTKRAIESKKQEEFVSQFEEQKRLNFKK